MPAIRRSSARLLSQDAISTSTSTGAVVPKAPDSPSLNPRLKSSRGRKRVPKSTDLVEGGAVADDQKLAGKTTFTVPAVVAPEPAEAFVPAVLSFDFEEAKRHLIQVDQRFEELFTKMKCKPFEHLEQVHPFRALTVSILGQQISWLAARSIKHKFIRLYDQSIPENPSDEERSRITSFPTPSQVANTDIAILRTAGLSSRKAEYIRDLATRFADGRLSTHKLLEADDDELARMLIEVRGIGRWTGDNILPSIRQLAGLKRVSVDMFAIFSLRRPDILPVGDLGVQRGMVRWFLSLHSPVHTYSLSPEKVGGTATPKKKSNTDNGEMEEASVNAGGLDETVSIPPAFTPSINKTLNKAGKSIVPLPSGIDVGLLKGRLDGKKKIKGAFLTPQEMSELTECWKPYRSVGK